MAALLDMSQIPLPDAVEVPSYAAILSDWKASYAAKMGVSVGSLDDNDPAVFLLEVGAYREMLLRQSVNDSVRNTLLSHAHGDGLDDLGADPLYGDTDRLVIDEGDPDAVPPVLPTYESDTAYRARLAEAPNELSVAGPVGAYTSIARGAHGDVVDVRVTSPNPSEILVEVLHDSADPDILTAVYEALSDETVRPVGDRITVESADKETATIEITVYVPDGPDLAVVQAASQARINSLVLPLAAKVRSGTVLSEGDMSSWLGACVVEGVSSWALTGSTGMSNDEAAWWPMTINVTAERSVAFDA